VAILSKKKPENVQKGFVDDAEDDQKRFIQATFKWKRKKITIMNGYFPQGENRSHETKFPKKIKFYDDLENHIKKLKKVEENLIVMGDFNVAPTDLDIGIGDQNVKRWLRDGKTAFLPEEIEMWNKIKSLGFIDTWREQNPDEGSIYSWFDYRSRMFDDEPKRGLRIDQILISENLKSSLVETGIDYSARAMEKPSDHCPIWVSLK
jgi:exodeoxyribonuclease-3